MDSSEGKRPSRIDRRSLLRAASGGGIALGAGVTPFAQSRAATKGQWDQTADLVVVGSGASGLVAAVIAASEGLKVVVLEAGPLPGGTTARSGGGMWIPNNHYLREHGLADPKPDALRYLARFGYPALYDLNSPTLGLPQNTFELLEALYDNGSVAIETLEALGALRTSSESSYDSYDHAKENKVPRGRVVIATPADQPSRPLIDGPLHPATDVTPAWYAAQPFIGGGGAELIRQLSGYLQNKGGQILTEHRATRLITNSQNEVIGLEAVTDDGERTVTFRALRAVHFGSGGFTHNADLAQSYLRGPTFAACAPLTNQGDLVYMATAVGAKLGNMQQVWTYQAILDQAIQTPSLATNLQMVVGDSVMLVNKLGRRVVNEKRNYTDRAEVHDVLDPNDEEWTNLVLFLIADQRVMDLCAGRHPYPAKGSTAEYILKGQTIEELTQRISERLAKFAPRTGGFQLDAKFAPNLKATMERFNGFAEKGVDEDFKRGSFRQDLYRHAQNTPAECIATNMTPNITMHPLSANGPYYAMLVVKSCSDSCGGPVVNARAQILSASNKPIPGLYGAGNCIAAPTGRADNPGGTLGPAVTFAYIAGRNISKEPVKAEA